MTHPPSHPPDDQGQPDSLGDPPLDPFEDALSSAPPPPPIPEILTRPVDHPAARERSGVSGVSGGVSGGGVGDIGGIGKAWGMAMDFVFTIIAAVGLAYLASIWLGHRQAWVLGGLGLGFAIAMMRIVRTTMREEAAERRKR